MFRLKRARGGPGRPETADVSNETSRTQHARSRGTPESPPFGVSTRSYDWLRIHEPVRNDASSTDPSSWRRRPHVLNPGKDNPVPAAIDTGNIHHGDKSKNRFKTVRNAISPHNILCDRPSRAASRKNYIVIFHGNWDSRVFLFRPEKKTRSARKKRSRDFLKT